MRKKIPQKKCKDNNLVTEKSQITKKLSFLQKFVANSGVFGSACAYIKIKWFRQQQLKKKELTKRILFSRRKEIDVEWEEKTNNIEALIRQVFFLFYNK